MPCSGREQSEAISYLLKSHLSNDFPRGEHGAPNWRSAISWGGEILFRTFTWSLRSGIKAFSKAP
ncbi:MAG: hypothetical protein DMG38_16820 [Acidobacteria bacterium]|nr:MAG: hypothetical protein DMG38_16820 [Acidobacteriota bacterium]